MLARAHGSVAGLVVAIAVMGVAWGDEREAAGQGIVLNPSEIVVLRGARVSPADEDRFVERFIASSPVFRAPVRGGALQRDVDGDARREEALIDGRRALDEAVEAYGRLDAKAGFSALDRARAAFTRALAGRAEAKRAFAELARVHLATAAFHLAVGNAAGAEEGFETALGIDAGARFDPARFSPAVTRALDEARGRFLRRVPVVTLVTSLPEGAVVELSGVTVGVTPLKLRVRPGHRALVLRRKGFEATVVPIVGAVPREVGATLAPTRLAEEWGGWCRGVVEEETRNAGAGADAGADAGAGAGAGAGRGVPKSLDEKRAERALIVVEAVNAAEFAVCGLVAGDAPAFGVRVGRDAKAAEVAAFWRAHDRVHRRFVLKRLSDRDALDARPITNLPPRKQAVVARRWYERWWVWAAVGAAVVAGGTVGVVFGVKGPATSGVSIRF